MTFMSKKFLKTALLATVLGSASAWAQVPCGTTKLVCLIPTALHTTSSSFNFFNEAFGTQIGQLPLATPASGFLFTFDKGAGVYTASQESFGPLEAERAETIGLHKIYVAFTYQRFDFSEIGGNNLKNLPILFYFPSQTDPAVVTATQNRLDTHVDQYVAFGTFGLTDRIDVALAVPIEKVTMSLFAKGTEFDTQSPATASFTEDFPGSASGVGDVVVSAKGTVFKHERLGAAVGMEMRFPTGDEQNFLGSGAFGIKPYVVFSRRGRIAPHVDFGYQWNADSALAKDQNGEHNLPAYFSYTLGADIGATKRVTVVADFLGQYFFNAPQVTTPQNVTATVNMKPVSFSTLLPTSGSYSVCNLGLGVKANPWKNLLVSANALIKLNDGGLRATVVPLVGLSYSF
jgi:hypothetical protein